MVRHRLAFNMDNPEHVRASKILYQQRQNFRTDFIVRCILAYEDNNTARETVGDYINADADEKSAAKSHKFELIKKTDSLSDIPTDVLNMDW